MAHKLHGKTLKAFCENLQFLYKINKYINPIKKTKMKKIKLITILSILTVLTFLPWQSNAQAPDAFKYQTVVRNASGDILQNQNVSLRFKIHDLTASGTVVYSESHSVTTNQFGLANVIMGQGTVISGNFSSIDWGGDDKYLQIELDPNGGNSYTTMGTTQFMSVPYAVQSSFSGSAVYSDISEYTIHPEDADADPANEIQSISKTDSIVTLSDGGGSFIDNVNDADADSTNEYNRSLALSNTTFEIEDGGGTLSVDLGFLVDDADADPANEIQTLSINGSDLSITNGNTVTIPSGADNLGNHTATQNIKLSNNWLSNDGGNEGVYVKTDGKVGIGTATPAQQLDVNGKVAINGLQTIYNAGAENSDFEGTLIIGDGGGNLSHSSSQQGESNTFVGIGAGEDCSTGNANTFVGRYAGNENTSGNGNSYFGYGAGAGIQTGWFNTCLGQATGYMANGSSNVFVGYGAGNQSGTGSSNIFIGYHAGTSETSSNKLYIENSNSTAPLIYGDFNSDSLAINGSLSIKDELIDASGDVGTSGQVLSSTGTGTDWINVQDDNDWTVSGNDMYSSPTGNVGVGTSSPAEKLDIEGNIALFGQQTIYNADAESGFPGTLVIGNGGTFLDDDNSTGGYYNTFVGISAGNDNSTGKQNVFMGYYAGADNISGENNAFIGRYAGKKNQSGSSNTFIGNSSGHQNTSGSGNVFIGEGSGYNEMGSNKLYIDNTGTTTPLIYGDFASDSIAINGNLNIKEKIAINGKQAIYYAGAENNDFKGTLIIGNGGSFLTHSSGSEGRHNTFVGNDAGIDNNTGNQNTFVGDSTGNHNTFGWNNCFIGSKAGKNNEGGNSNTFMGKSSGEYNKGSSNSFYGYNSGLGDGGYQNSCFGVYTSSPSGQNNSFFGARAGGSSGEMMDNNSFFGASSGNNHNRGDRNTFIGMSSGYADTSGYNNTYLGYNTGRNNINGHGNVFIGYQAGQWEYGSNKLYIASSPGSTYTPLIYGDFSTDSLVINGSLSIRDELIDASGDKGTTGQVLTSTSTGINWTDASSLDDGDWTVTGNNMCSAPTGNVGIGVTNPSYKFEVMGSTNYAYMCSNNFAVYGNLNSTNKGDYAIYGYGTDASGEDGDAYGFGHTLGAVKGYNYYGNPYTFGTAGFSYLDYNRSGGVYGSDYNGNNWGSLAYKNSSGSTYGGYFTTTTTGSGKASDVKINNGIGVYGELFGADIHGGVYGAYVEGDNYSIYSDGDVYKNGLDVHLQEESGENQVLYTNVSTDVTIMTSGIAILDKGTASISFDDSFSKVVSDNEAIVVTVTPIGNSNGIYLNSVDKNGFEISENNDGKSNVTVSYIAIGKRKGYENPVLAQEVIAHDYTSKLEKGLHNDNDMGTDGEGLYFENGKLKVGVHSSTLPDMNKPAQKERGLN
jgi:hypothetical protein